MPATFKLTTEMPCSAEELWRAVHDPLVLRAICAPLVELTPAEPPVFPEEFVPATYVVKMKAFGFLPLGRQAMQIEHPAPEPGEQLPRFLLRDHGTGQLARVWHHEILIVPVTDQTCRYSDLLEIDAGLLTPPVAAFARTYFRHRQRRLKEVASSGLALT